MNDIDNINRILNKINRKRHDYIRELDLLDSKKKMYTEMLSKPKLRRLNTIEIQKELLSMYEV